MSGSLALVAALLLGAPADNDLLCVNSVEVLGLALDQAARVEQEVAQAVASEALTMKRLSPDDPDNDRCETGALGVLHVSLVRAGENLHVELRAIDPRSKGAMKERRLSSERARGAVLALESELRKLIGELRKTQKHGKDSRGREAQGASAANAPQEATPATVAARPGEAVPPIEPLGERAGRPAPRVLPSWTVLGLWGGAGLCLTLAAGFELDAWRRKGDVEEGVPDAETANRRGVRSQNTARTLSVLALALAGGGFGLWWWEDRNLQVGVAPAARGLSVVGRF